MPFLGTRGAGSNRAFGYAGAAKPNQVTGLTATDFGTSRAYNNGRIDLSWTAPGNNGATISGYLIERSTDNSTYSTLVANTGTSATTYSDTSLTSSQIYYYKVSAINPAGTGDASTAANATATTVPQAPTIGTATAAAEVSQAVDVTYTAGATGGKAVSVYTATSSPGSITGTGASPIRVSGLTNGTPYTFTVTATNANGTSTASSASNSATPAVPLPLVSGGSLSSDATYYYRVFTSSGTLGVSGGSVTFDTLVVAGGGPGGANLNSYYPTGGGGAGGVLYTGSRTYSSNQTVTIGAAGNTQAYDTGDQATNGGASSLAALSAVGGGYGWHGQGSGGPTSGGSGGGGPSSGAAGTSGQGNAGGGGAGIGTASGGGGGFAAAGTAGNSSIGGSGGNGTSAYSAWGVGNIAGGGYGLKYTYPNGTPGTAGLGSNGYGGGGNACQGSRCGGAGQQGVVAVRYLKTAARN